MIASVFHLLNPLLLGLVLPVLGLFVESGFVRDVPAGQERPAVAPASVPEPDVTSLIGGLGTLMLLRRRR